MTKKLRDYFPMLQTREVILKEINNNEKMWSTFYSWEEERQEEFLDFCTGARGVKVMYDFVSKEVLNPESTPERIDELLSLLLKQEVHVMEVLPNDGTRLADESSLVIMDIVVQLSDGSIANLEIQKIGYKFPGERTPAIPQICCCGSISGCEVNERKNSVTKTSKMYIQLCCLKTVLQNLKNFQMYIFILSGKNQIRDWNLICCKNMYS